ncbi:carboxypeptidase regulatory-like domain-containing protein [Nocardioides pantholopis]|uniref:carboxypeptidase regulatory-like domain-containing protein n=1 Tax=Nocardioides pantholopis TaxID=2483798 RepID=UPI0013DDC5CD|nr:carboxypeptidase regulatory-like domain-containing protein [Nocardioides pantholopis]
MSRLVVVLLAVAAVLAGLLVGSPASAADGSLSGVVQVKPAGGPVAPLAGADVHLYRSATTEWSGELVRSVRAGADGSWSAAGLEDGYYFVRVIAPEGSPAEEYWENAWSPYEVTPVRVDGNAVRLPRPIVLETPGWVQGRVVDEAGRPVVGAFVSFRASESSGSYGLETGADGRYDSRTGDHTDALLPGSYLVAVRWYSDDLDDPVYRESEARVTVSAGAGATHDVTLVERPAIVMTVLDEEGQPLANAPLHLQVRTPDFKNGVFGPIQSGPHETDASGRYLVGDSFEEVKVFVGLPEGYQGSAVGEWWDGAYSFAEARSLTFPAGAPLRREITVRLGSAPTAVQAVTPGIRGVARVGRTLTAYTPGWGPSGVEMEYQWLDSGFVIPGATGSSFTIPATMAGSHGVSVRVTGRVPGQPAVDRVSPWTGEVLPSDGSTDMVAGIPKITGRAEVGHVLAAIPGTWFPAGVTLSWVWTAGGKQVGTGRYLKVTNALAGKSVLLVVRGELGGASTVVSSNYTVKVRGVLTAARPKVTGKAQVGRKLRARAGAWGPGKVTVRLAWFRNGTKVKKATGTTYRLTRKDVGKRISVRATGSRRHFDTVTTRSAKTGRVTR